MWNDGWDVTLSSDWETAECHGILNWSREGACDK